MILIDCLNVFKSKYYYNLKKYILIKIITTTATTTTTIMISITTTNYAINELSLSKYSSKYIDSCNLSIL